MTYSKGAQRRSTSRVVKEVDSQQRWDGPSQQEFTLPCDALQLLNSK